MGHKRRKKCIGQWQPDGHAQDLRRGVRPGPGGHGQSLADRAEDCTACHENDRRFFRPCEQDRCCQGQSGGDDKRRVPAQGHKQHDLDDDAEQCREKSARPCGWNRSQSGAHNQPERSGKAGPDDDQPGRHKRKAAGFVVGPQAAADAGNLGDGTEDAAGCCNKQSGAAQALHERQGRRQEEQGEMVRSLP